MTIGQDLTPKLQKLVLRVEDDLRTRLDEDPELKAKWQSEHAEALRAERTSSAWVSWRDDRITQAAVGWVLTTVFLRFCEDNALLSKGWISGPGTRRQEAYDAENAYFRAHPENTWREWILEGITHLQFFPATTALVDQHAALWQVSPSGAMAKEILDFWRATDEAGVPLHDFQDSELSTRFLGDLYQDLSEYAKKTFALLQTPEFVEEFILDQTLTPALAERPLEGFRLIDPTCGSGHFLLGGFQRLLDEWGTRAPNLDTRERVQKALDSIHGVDLNPFAVAIARFRLTVAALKATGELDLERAPAFDFHLCAGDSLLHGHAQREFRFDQFDADSKLSGFAYATENLDELKEILKPGRYDVVVGNPPYIAAPNDAPKKRYRELYPSISGQLTLTVPFMERFFGLAKLGSSVQPAGWTGQITGNSFMKRDFGVKLIEDFLPRQDLLKVIDSEGAWIPGHNSDGTPTVILIGKHQPPVRRTVRAVLSKGLRESRGSAASGSGPYWRSIVEHIDGADLDNEWVTITDVPRDTLSAHPWSLSGGAANDVLAIIEGKKKRLAEYAKEIGRTTHTGNDEAFFMPRPTAKTHKLEACVMPVVLGEEVRDYHLEPANVAIFPYSASGEPIEPRPELLKHLWPVRRSLETQLDFQQTKAERGLRWFDHSMFFPKRFRTPLSIAFAFVATHNHFVLDRGGKVFKQSAPVIKLPKGATEDEHIALVGALNSSTACFWLKQKSQPKGGAADLFWSRTYEFTSTTIKDLPLPKYLPHELGRDLDSLASQRASLLIDLGREESVPNAGALKEARSASQHLRRRMIAAQEELDWHVYNSYGVLAEDLTLDGPVPDIELGQRAFEIEMARRPDITDEQAAWFTKHGSTACGELPQDWPADYRRLVLRRIDAIENNPNIRLLESPEYKRRWVSESWEQQQETVLGRWLLDKLEARSLWFDAQDRPAARTISQLADIVSRDRDLVDVLALWDGAVDVDIVKALTRLLTDEAVPYLAAQRLKEPVLRKREAWEETWDLQRREDAGEDVGRIPVPPKYTGVDFRKASWWQARGKLDVPKERFILYPEAGRSTDATLLLGWAGWDHVQQFLVLATIMDERITEGADDAQLIPLVAGMAEVLPWVRQWHVDLDPTFGMSMADFCSAQLEERMTQLNVSTTDLKAWRPAAATRSRRAIKENA